ncbi:type II toxin-antitoxin system tRNA(fMet)-specific endonuclease VapC [Leptolyngbya sp. NK1-12]|uniref:type II toxin-antitoxin system tRNA(fMet)-specific endonuclease VapC n=1 Tax=Leptolyngbya sp. NK1-12 TaxID=2547451 RepID=UPI002931EE98|nr:type II toxin-antitoxin system VapC family toxin [Leptolyngbya sp. NK1-12]
MDTNTCIVYLRGRNSNLRQRLDNTPVQDMAVCSVVKAELAYGAMKSANPQQNFALQQAFLRQFTSLPFDDLSAVAFGTIRAQLETVGTPIGSYDLQIAAIALANNLTLITHNNTEFSRVDGLEIEDWEVEV